MRTSTLTIKGQITVPKELRDAFGWKAGDRVEFVREPDGVKILPVQLRTRGEEVVARLRQAQWDQALTTDRLMAMTRGRGGK